MRPILLLEDETDDVTLTERAIAAAGITNPLHTAATISEGKQYLLQAVRHGNLPALLILDFGLPDGRGDTLLEWLRQQPEPLGGVPVIVVTVSPERRDQMRAERLGAVLYLLKPVDPELLSRAVASLGLRVTEAAGGAALEGS